MRIIIKETGEIRKLYLNGMWLIKCGETTIVVLRKEV